jgi:hypothetical protein
MMSENEDAETMADDGGERNMGEQPIAKILVEKGLKAHDLVAASRVPMTHKMIARACKGRRLTARVQSKVLDALNAATQGTYTLKDLFTY